MARGVMVVACVVFGAMVFVWRTGSDTVDRAATRPGAAPPPADPAPLSKAGLATDKVVPRLLEAVKKGPGDKNLLKALQACGRQAEAAVPVLVRQMADADGLDRRAGYACVLWSLGRQTDDEVAAVRAALAMERATPQVEVLELLGGAGTLAGRLVPEIATVALADVRNADGAAASIRAAGESALPGLDRLLEGEDARKVVWAAAQISKLGPGTERAAKAVIRALESRGIRDEYDRGQALYLLGSLPGGAAVGVPYLVRGSTTIRSMRAPRWRDSPRRRRRPSRP